MITPQIISAVAFGAVVSVIVTVATTIATELSAPFKSWLARFTGHHWLTKSWFSIITLVIGSAIFRFFGEFNITKTHRTANMLIWTVILGFVVLLCFYLFKYFKQHGKIFS